MGKAKISDDTIRKLRKLRKSGKSVKEIVRDLNLGTGTVSKYSKGVFLSKRARDILEEKKYPAKNTSRIQKNSAVNQASQIIGTLSSRDFFLILSGLYWGEGTKRELNLINGDPELILFFIKGLLSLGIDKKRIKISIRYYSNQNKEEVTLFWLKKLALDSNSIVGFERVEGGIKKSKLVYGMCRVRVEKSSYYHKLVTSAIHILSSGSSIG